MTREEAVTKLTNVMNDDIYSWSPSILTAFSMAVDALRGADGDCISRQAAIEVLRNRWLKTRNYDGIGEDIAEECEIYLKTLPSAQPEPCEEREKGECPYYAG